MGFHEKAASAPGSLANGVVCFLFVGLFERMGQDLHTVKGFSTEVLHRFAGQIYTYEAA